MSKLRIKLASVLAVLLCAMLTLSAVLFIQKNKSVEAYSSLPQSPTIGEVYDDGKQRFDYTNMQALYKALTGNSNIKSLSEVESALNVSASGISTSGNTTIASKEITVKFGGMTWCAVYLSKAAHTHTGVVENATVGTTQTEKDTAGYADDGDIVLTLWLAYTGETAQWQRATVSAGSGLPANLYGTSYIRSVVLNNGGRYWKGTGNSLYADPGKDPSNEYGFARFTMDKNTYPNVQDSVTDFIVSPRYISWQYQQSAIQAVNYNVSNDAWGKMRDDFNTGYNYENSCTVGGTDYYPIWKDDLLWLPSIAEIGNVTGSMWEVTTSQMKCQDNKYFWSRSAGSGSNTNVYPLNDGGMGSVNDRNANNKWLVRPALHLNLSKADEDARKIFFGTSETIESTADGFKIMTKEHEYDDVDAEIIIPDIEKLEKVGNETNGSYFNSTSGRFYARETLADNGSYEITVKPTGGCYWADAKSDSEKQKERKYAIHINPATLSVDNMANPLRGVSVSGSLLQSGYTVSSNKLGIISSPTMKYYKVEPADYASATRPPDDQFVADDGTFTASSEGTYRVYYIIEVAHHTALRGYYDVIVSGTDSAKLVYTGTAYTSDYGDTNAILLEDADELKAALQANMKVQKDGADDPARFNAVWDKLEAVVCTKDGSNYKPAEKNAAGHYDVGTYYVDLQYKQGESQSIALSWDGELPSFEITKRNITVQVIADGDGELSSIYGETHAAMKFELLFGTLAEGEDLNGDEGKYKLPFGDFLVQVEEEEPVVLNTYTPVGIYKVTADISKIINYTVKIERQNYDYEVKARPVTLKVTDVSVVYGTDLSSYNFKLTVAVGTLANGALVTEVITKSNSTYSLYLDGKEVARGNDVAVGEYDIGVTVTADNYKFEYIYGTLTVTKADFDLSGIELKNAGYVYDGKPHAAEISGTLPEGVSVTYEYHLNGEKIDGIPTEKGLYTVYAKFTLADTDNYNEIPDKVAYLKIASSQAELDKGFPDEAPDPDGNNKDNGGETPDPNPNPNPSPDPSEELENKKNAAKDELDKAAQAKKDAIDNDPNLTDEQKQAAKDKVDKELQAGKEAIDKATDESGVNAAESSAKTNIGNISIDPIGGNTEDGGSFPWWIIAVAAGVLLLLIALVIVIVKRRQVADGDEDFYDEDYDFDEEDFEEDFSDDDF